MLDWKNSPYRKPLILKGVRQVGKTWILKEFGRRCYENTAYFNFDENEEYKQFFETTKDVDRILQNLMLASGQKILPEKTLIIFDEVQDCPKVINSMKYFCENAPQYHVACAGSLLGIALAKPSSFPVGKVNFMQIDPMTFAEFLLANGDENLAQYLEQVDTRLVHKIYRSSAPGLPIAAYDDLSAFKIYLVDVGLLRRLAQLSPTAFGEGNRLFTEFKGALTENFVLQTLITQFEVMPRYWSQNNPPYKVDFLIQRENDILPVEVKSEVNTTSKSMKKFKELFPDKVKLRIRFSLDNLKLDDDVLNIPLFMADQADRLIGLALEKRKH